MKGNDPFLYGEKVKAYLRKGAQRVGGYEEYPNVEVGWGENVIIRSHGRKSVKIKCFRSFSQHRNEALFP